MTQARNDRPRVVFLFSDTGGGHRSAAEAIIEAVELEYPGKMRLEMVDFFRRYAPLPLSRAPEMYPPLTRLPDLWSLGYHMSDGELRTRFFYSTIWPYVRRGTYRLVASHPADLYVSVHPLCNTPVLRAGRGRIPHFMTVVTDMVTTHAAWFNPRADLIVVPTDAARERALELGIRPERLRVVGLPVADRFCHPAEEKMEIRARLGWETDRPVILLVGGGEGMGPLERIARAVNEAGLLASLVIVAGRNQSLRERLEAYSWKMPVHVYGFVREMPDFMRAADMLVSKAGPGTISEAFISGLPIILYSRLPGQEDGNVTYVREQGAGVWAPETEQVVAALRLWVYDPKARQKAADAAHRLAKPESSRQIAHLIAGLLQLAP